MWRNVLMIMVQLTAFIAHYAAATCKSDIDCPGESVCFKGECSGDPGEPAEPPPEEAPPQEETPAPSPGETTTPATEETGALPENVSPPDGDVVAAEQPSKEDTLPPAAEPAPAPGAAPQPATSAAPPTPVEKTKPKKGCIGAGCGQEGAAAGATEAWPGYRSYEESYRDSKTTFMERRKRSVLIGNITFLVGTLMDYPGLGLQIAGLATGENGLLAIGFSLSMVSAVPKLAGLLTSGIAATRVAKRGSRKRGFKWGFFGGGLGVNLAANIVGNVLIGKGAPVAAVAAVFVSGAIIRDLFFGVHCMQARSRVGSISFASLTPIIDIHNKSYGLAATAEF